MEDEGNNVAFNRAQAARARRLAESMRYSHPEIAAELEKLAVEFDKRIHGSGQSQVTMIEKSDES